MSLREFWAAFHAVLLYDRALPTVLPETLRARSEETRRQIDILLGAALTPAPE